MSKVRRNLIAPFIMPAALVLLGVIFNFWRPPTMGFGFLYLFAIGGAALILCDRITEFDKYQPPTKDGDLARTTVARSGNGAP